MDQETFELLRARLESIDRNLRDLSADLKVHVGDDRRYWQEIDKQSAQISLLKWMFSGAIASMLAASFSWLATKLGIR